MAFPLEQITKEKVLEIKKLVKLGWSNSKILEEVFENKNGHHTGTYHSIIDNIRKLVK